MAVIAGECYLAAARHKPIGVGVILMSTTARTSKKVVVGRLEDGGGWTPWKADGVSSCR